MIEEQLGRLINGTFIWRGEEIGWVRKESYRWDVVKFVKLLKEEGIRVADYLMVNGRKARELENILGDKLNEVREVQVREELRLPRR